MKHESFDHVTDPKLRAILSAELNLTLNRLLYVCQHTMAAHLEDEALYKEGLIDTASYEAREAAMTESIVGGTWPEPPSRWETRLNALRKYWLA